MFLGTEQHSEAASIRLINGASLLLGFADAFWIYMSSSYLREATGTENVGLFYGVVFAFVLVLLLSLHLWIRWLGKTTLLVILLFLLTFSTLILAALPVSFLGMMLLGGVIASMTVTWVVLDIVLEDFSADSRSGRIRGWYLTLMNIGIFAGPLAASQTMNRIGFGGIFLVSALAYTVVFFRIMLGLRLVNRRFRKRVVLADLWPKIRRAPDILRIYGVSFALEFFFVVMIIYMPLRLLDLGFGWEQIGVIFTVMLLPFVVLQYPLGVMADTKWGEKELLLFSLGLLAVSVGMIAFSESRSFWFWASILCVTRIGAAVIEVLRDAYFYKQIDGDDGDVIAFFRTARPVAYMAAAGLTAVALLRFPVTSVFVVSAGMTLIVFGTTLFLRDTEIATG